MKTWKDFELEVEKLEPLDPFPPMYYVCSHGASVRYPVLVSKENADWLKSEGAKVYTREEYLNLRKRL
jgi:hypothetical protein